MTPEQEKRRCVACTDLTINPVYCSPCLREYLSIRGAVEKDLEAARGYFSRKPHRVLGTDKAELVVAMLQHLERRYARTKNDWTWTVAPIGNGEAIIECFETNGQKIGHWYL
jgi:hypothetical protein